jgi:glycosyltransferase involved in cell wall biosynthesis
VFEIAVKLWAADPADVARLEAHGWSVVDGSEVAPDPDAFRRYVQGSGAELSVAKGAFVRTASGWFSDRTTRYLASGKPAVVQDTGFTRAIPAGKGLFAFRTLEDAVAAVEQIQADYEGHSRAARALAEQHFDSDVVLSRFLEVAGVGGR